MKPLAVLALATMCLLITACGDQETAVSVPGSDEDAHGCKASAGYQWCEATQKCERPWELAETEGFENTAEAFEAFCEASG
jgi:hypothetical protein